MNFECTGSSLLLAVAAIVFSQFLCSPKLVSAQDEEQVWMDLHPTCLGNLASLLEDEGHLRIELTSDQFIGIEFKLKFGCNPPTLIDQGVRLEIRLRSATFNKTKWLPIRYYTPSLAVPSNYTSFVELDSSNDSVTAQDLRYNISFPLLLINSSKPVVIREYIYGKYVEDFSEDMQLELRWMQSFGRRAKTVNEATWILDDVDIRIWNRTCFLQVLKEDFSNSNTATIINSKLAQIQQPTCGSPGSGPALEFSGILNDSTQSTWRSINIASDLSYIFASCEEQEDSSSDPVSPNHLSCPTDSFSAALENIVTERCHLDGNNEQHCRTERNFKCAYRGNAQCHQEVIIGGGYTSVAMVNTTIVPTCFTCLDENNMPASTPTEFFYMDTPFSAEFIPLNYDVTQTAHHLFVTNFTSLPMLMDGTTNTFKCIDSTEGVFMRNVTTLKPVQAELERPVAEFYVEGSNVEVSCVNKNVAPFLGHTIWVDDANKQVGSGGILRLHNILPSRAGIYRCMVILVDTSVAVEIPAPSFTLVVHSAPNVTTINSPLEAFDINSTLILMCNFEGVPLPSLKWMHNGLPVGSINNLITTTTTSGMTSGTSTLQLMNTSKYTVGTFTCVATNNLGSANRSFNVQIQTDPFTPSSVLTTPSSDVTTPSSDVTTTSSDVATPSSDVITHTSDVTTPSSDVITPASDVNTPSSDVSTPTSDVTTPSPGVTTPSSDVITPTSDVITPSSDVTTPSSDVITPTSDVTTPLSDVTRPLPDILAMIFDDGDPDKKLDELLNMNNGSLSQAIIDIVISSATDSLKNLSNKKNLKTGVNILKFMDLFLLRGYNSSYGKVSNDIYTFDVKEVFPDYKKPETRLEVFRESEVAISLPAEILFKFPSYAKSGIRVASFLLKNPSGIFPVNTEDDKIMFRYGSPIVSATLGCMGRRCNTSNLALNNPVLIEIQHFNNISGNEEPGCWFFDFKKSIWSSRGCKRSSMSNSTFSVCECNHLTHFAILLSPGVETDDKNILALKIIGYVGVTISVVCIIATIFTLTFIKALWGMRTFIQINLCICLGISQVIFISAVDKTGIEELCLTIAIVLHYFWLTTFMWMLMEGVVLYVVLVRVFIKQQYLYMIGFTVASYGLPALYVFCVAVPIGLAVTDDQERPQYIQYNAYTNITQACWLRYDTHFIWAFITPVLIIIIVNIGFFCMAISIMWKHEKRVTNKSKLEKAKHWLKTGISLMVVLGIPWILGVLYFDEKLVFLAYIITIAISFQGMFIFILFVVLSIQVKEHYRSWWRSKKGEHKFLTRLFSSSGNGGSNKSTKDTHSNSCSAMKDRALQTPTMFGDEDQAATTSGSLAIRMVDCNGKEYNFEGNDINQSNDKQSSSQDLKYSTTIENCVASDIDHMTSDVSHVTSNCN